MGLTRRFTLPEELPPLRLLLVWDNLTLATRHPSWCCGGARNGIMPLYTPVGGSWLNMAEFIQRVLKRRALAGQHPHSPAEIGRWFEEHGTLLERAGDAVRLERQASAAATALREGAGPSRRRLRSLHLPAAPSAQITCTSRMPNPTADDPLVDRDELFVQFYAAAP